jgi:hypothetical protein
MNMPGALVIVARILRQGPQAPLAGDGLALPVYEYEAVESVGLVTVADRLEVAHREADVDDPGFAPGRLRRLHLSPTLPKDATLLYASNDVPRGGPVWYCARSEPVSDP